MKRSIPFYLALFITVRTITNTMVRMTYPFLPVFSRGLGVSIGMLSFGITLRQASGLLGPILASVGDSYGRKAGMLFGIALFTAGAAVILIWPSYLAFVLMMILGIMANFVFVPSMQAFLSDRVPYRQRGMALGLTELGWSLAYIFGIAIAGFLINRFGWQAPFPWLFATGVLVIVILGLVLPSDIPAAGQRAGLIGNLKQVFSSASARAAFVFALALSGANEMINITFAVWLEDAFQVKIAALAATAVVIGLSELSGEASASFLSDRLGKHRAPGAGIILNILAALALPLLGRSLWGAMAGLFLIYLSFEFTLVSSLPLASEVLPAARATLMAVYIACMGFGRALGASAASLLYSWGSGWLPQDLPGILPVVIAAALVGLLALAALRLIQTQVQE